MNWIECKEKGGTTCRIENKLQSTKFVSTFGAFVKGMVTKVTGFDAYV